jgi:transcriptional regulator with PAS, ATPase and Fis domain
VATGTDTKPAVVSGPRASRTILRVVFCVDRPVVPPALVNVTRDGLAIGRKVDQGLRLEDARISAHHATVRRTETGALVVVDESSKNGTFVNGVRVERSTLELGDVLSVGDTCLVASAASNEPEEDAALEGLLGDSADMRRVRAVVRRIGPSPVTVLLEAESGCGKEVVANALHRESGARGEFVPVNCAAVPESLFESQFFGHKAGAFTGAISSAGLFRAAVNGTLFLDEVGELPLALQPKLLRAIQERAIVPLGETRAVPCPVRIVAATNRDLTRAVEAGTFRGDLLARLFEAKVSLSPLRERREDILAMFALPFDGPPSMTHALAEALLLHAWPFNVREVLAVAREMRVNTGDQPLGIEAFRARFDVPSSRASAPAAAGARRPRSAAAPPDAAALAALLERKGGNVADVARELGRSRRQVYRWLAKYQLAIDAFRD